MLFTSSLSCDSFYLKTSKRFNFFRAEDSGAFGFLTEFALLPLLYCCDSCSRRLVVVSVVAIVAVVVAVAFVVVVSSTFLPSFRMKALSLRRLQDYPGALIFIGNFCPGS